MKKIYLLLSILSGLSISLNAQSAFTAGNIVVYKIGNGTTLSSAAFPVTLDEFKPNGDFVLSHPMPTAVSGSNKRIVESGSATSDGLLTRSSDGQYLVVSGYDADPATASVASTTSAATNRMVGIVDYNGNIDASTALSDAYSGNNFRGAISTNGTDIWTAGTASSGGGVHYTTKGSTTSTVISGTTITNFRSVNIFNGQLYASSASGAFQGISTIGSGTPKSGTNTVTLLNGFPTASGPSSYEFAMNTAGTIIYVADDRATASGGGIQKWTLSSGTWLLAYTLNSGLTSGARGITVDWSGTNPVIYATTADATANKIVTATDGGSSSSFTTLATAAANYIYRGIAFAPVVSNPVPVTLIKFNAALNNNTVQLQYLHDYFGPLMANNPNKPVFDFITSGDITPTPANFDEVMQYLSDTRTFIENYHAHIETSKTAALDTPAASAKN